MIKIFEKIIPDSSVFKSIAASFVLKFSAVFLSFLVSVFLARVLGSEELGIYSFATSILLLLIMPASLGWPSLLVRLIAQYSVNDNWGKAKGLLNFAFLSSIIITAIVCLISYLLLKYDYFPQAISEYSSAIALILFILPFAVFTSLFASVIRGLHLIIHSQVPELILRPLLLLVFISISVFYNFEISANIVLLLYALASVGGLVYCLIILNREMPIEMSSAKPIYKIKQWLNSSMPLLLSGGMFLINTKADIIMLGTMSTAIDVGEYQVASRTAALITVVFTVFTTVIASKLAQLHIQNNFHETQSLLSLASKASFLMTLPLAIIVFIGGDWLLGLVFGEQFIGSFLPLCILTGANLFGCFMGASALMLNMAGNEKLTAIGVGIAATVNIVLNIILIPRFGSAGAAIATAASLAVWNIFLTILVKIVLGLNTTALSFNSQK